MSTQKKPPLLLRGGLTGRVYVVTSYVDHGRGRIEAQTKHDVTNQYEALRTEDEARSLTEGPAPCGCPSSTRVDGLHMPSCDLFPRCSCGKPFPEDGGREGVCECCSECEVARVPSKSEWPRCARSCGLPEGHPGQPCASSKRGYVAGAE